MSPTNVSNNAPWLQVQQELSDLRPGFIAAVVEIWSDLVIDAVHVVSLELTGSLLHHVCASCRASQCHVYKDKHIIAPNSKSVK